MQSIKTIKRGDKDYPESLENISDPPEILYYLGNLSILGKNIGVVGTRQITKFGQEVTEKITKELVEEGFVIVSGMALGVDAVAHWTALKNGGKTVAVLGAGVDVIYPRENTHLYNSILEAGGLIISEVAPGRTVQKEMFPARNRIISGLSEAVVVTEAALKSGSLITARLALEQGREVFAVPGSPGPDYLIEQGASLILKSEDKISF